MHDLVTRWVAVLSLCFGAATAGANPPVKPAPAPPALDSVLRVGRCGPGDRIITEDTTLEMPAQPCPSGWCAPFVSVQLETGVANRCTAPGKCITGSAKVTFDPAPATSPPEALGPRRGDVRAGEVSLTFGKGPPSRRRFRAVIATPTCG